MYCCKDMPEIRPRTWHCPKIKSVLKQEVELHLPCFRSSFVQTCPGRCYMKNLLRNENLENQSHSIEYNNIFCVWCKVLSDMGQNKKWQALENNVFNKVSAGWQYNDAATTKECILWWQKVWLSRDVVVLQNSIIRKTKRNTFSREGSKNHTPKFRGQHANNNLINRRNAAKELLGL